MIKFAMILAAGASLLLPLAITTPAQAVCNFCSYNPPTGGGGGGDGGDGSYVAGEPFNPFDPGNSGSGGEGKLRDQVGDKTPKGNPGGDPNGDPTLPGYVAGLPLCKTELGDLPRVRARAIDKVDHGVDVVAICTNHNLMDQQDGMASIRSAIDDNDAMHHALRASGGFSANDVVAIVLDGEGAKLYVHVARSASR